jgi:hypothetical protein
MSHMDAKPIPDIAGARSTATETMGGLQATLTIVNESVSGIPVPGLTSAVGGLLSLLTAFRVHPLVT